MTTCHPKNRIQSLVFFVCVGLTHTSVLHAEDPIKDRHRFWISSSAAVANQRPGPTDQTNLPLSVEHDASPESLADELRLRIAQWPRPWTDPQAAEIFQRYCRMSVTGNRAIAIPPAIQAWIPSAKKIEVQPRATQRSALTGWSAGTYSIAQTPHFSIASQGTAKQVTEIADLCEETYAIWRQIFFSSWCSSERLLQALTATESPTQPLTSKWQVVVFRNRDAYIRQLQQLEPNVAISTGYYSPKLRTVFCYWDEATSVPTLRHELTHLFCAQTGDNGIALLESLKSDFWVVEGLALYMESIRIDRREGYEIATVGGWDSPRLQPARYRRLHDEAWIPWDEFRRADSQRFRQGAEIKQWYSQAAGLAHFWMDGPDQRRQAFLEYLGSVYNGMPDPSLLDVSSDDALRHSFDQFLMLSETTLAALPPSSDVRDVVLSRCPVTSATLLGWPTSNRTFDWLDVSFTRVDDDLFVSDRDALTNQRWDLRRFNAESTSVSDVSLPSLAKMPRLEELDLSRCKVSDRGMLALHGHRSMKTLWLTGNPEITDRSLSVLASLPKLELVDLGETSVTEAGWKSLLVKVPRLRRKER